MSCCKYVDDCLVVSEKAESILRDEIGKYWNLKESSIGKPKIYLGGKCREVELDNGTNCWAFGSSQYVQSFVDEQPSCSAQGRSFGVLVPHLRLFGEISQCRDGV